MLSYYNRLSSEVYDLDKPIGQSFGDVEFYLKRLANCKGPILEPATGTGRMIIPLLEAGLSVDGFDSSPDMLKICKANCQKRELKADLFEANMESFYSNQRYEAIIVPTGTFLLLHKREKSIQTLQNFRDHLRDGGRLIVDLTLQTDFHIGKISTRTWECENGDVITHENKLVEVDVINQFTISHGRYEKWRDGELIQTELERFPLRWYGVEEFRNILESLGFEGIIISGDYSHGVYPNDHKQVITFEATYHERW